MNKTALLIGIVSVTIALVLYTIATFKIQKNNKIKKMILFFQLGGVSFDILGTIAMYLIRPGFSITLHGIIGFIALFFMILKSIIIAKLIEENISKRVKYFSILTYIYWVIVFVLGMSL